MAEAAGFGSPDEIDVVLRGDGRRFFLAVVSGGVSVSFAWFAIKFGWESVPEPDVIVTTMKELTGDERATIDRILPWFLISRSLIIVAALGASVAFFKGAQVLSRSQFVEMRSPESRDPRSLFSELAEALKPVVELMQEITKLKGK
jgi:hypothetical protein